MSALKLRQSFENLGRALARLSEATRESPEAHPFLVDATIQRFEFCLELYWKVLKRLLAYEGVEANSPRAALKHAYAQGWLEGEGLWLDMLDDRNQTSHVYDEKVAAQIFARVQGYLPEMSRAYEALRTAYADVLRAEA